MTNKSHAEKAAALAALKHRLEAPLVVDVAEARHPDTSKPYYRFKLVDAGNANGAAYSVLVDDHGQALESTDALEQRFDRPVLDVKSASVIAPIVINPDTNVLVLNPGATLDETITVTVPKNAGPTKADVYFLADTTGSMGTILNAVQVGANNVLASLNALGLDLMFGVGNYKDFASGDPYGFQHQVSPTSAAAAVATGINAWSANGGGDLAEAALFALDSLAVPPGPGIGWRAGSKRIVVWFGDAPSHDPICNAVSSAPTVTEAGAIARLVNEGIIVLAISTATPGLDGDPTVNADGYQPQCGAPGGAPGQASRLTAATGGALAVGINAGNIVNTIIALVKAAVGSLQNVKLVPSSSVAPFVTSIDPPAGYGPLAGEQDYVLTFKIRFTGVPCGPEEQVVTGAIDALADGKTVASKAVKITVPACQFVYAVDFVCGPQNACSCECSPVQAGRYATSIAIHNYSLKPVEILKRFVPLVLSGAAIAREPRTAGARAEDRIVLPAQTATMDDCCRIAEELLGAVTQESLPLTTGLIEITASADVAVTAVYTTSGSMPESGVSIDVKQVTARR
ncbi:vWA domain-containing protein [Paraburkholderia sp. DGU8]|uniref:vWA domain-containing protein n=1 Tax=Paraburkholderia sp. DGU8 TaxID=3161997 RepID=UPI00346762AA